MVKNFLVSDYDGTYKMKPTVLDDLKKNNFAVQRFIDKGNIFMMATGRVFESIHKEFIEFDLKANYISCAEANVLFNNNFELLYYNTISKQDILKIKDYYKLLDEMIGKDPYGNVSSENIVEYNIRYKDEKSKRIFVENLRHNKLFAFYHDPLDPLNAHLFDKRNDKVKAIQFVATLENIPKNKIYTIGDGYNDLSMIEEFNGFAVKNAKYAAKFESLVVYNTVSDLVDDIEKENVPKRQRKWG